MSDAIVPFLFALRGQGVRVGTTEAVTLARALVFGLHESSLDRFYHVARSICVHREGDLDAFDQAFSTHFRGAAANTLAITRDLLSYLQDPIARRTLSDDERALLESLDLEELKRLFEERLREQKERHDGGNRWIGTGGTSPFGAFGAHPTGLRVGPNGGGRSAMAVADARRYKPYRSDLVLDTRQVEAALRRLRMFSRDEGPLELDIDETIAKTSKNGGEIDIVMRPARRPNVRVLLLMDVGGSMDPYAETVSQLFSAARRASNFKELRSYYFHNCIYGHVFATERFTDPIKVHDLLVDCHAGWKLVVVGDAAMHPAELLGSGDSYWASQRGTESLTGIKWMTLLADHFRMTAWLNPDPPSYWRSGTAEALSTLFPMYSLTLDGIKDAMSHLSRGKTRRN